MGCLAGWQAKRLLHPMPCHSRGQLCALLAGDTEPASQPLGQRRQKPPKRSQRRGEGMAALKAVRVGMTRGPLR